MTDPTSPATPPTQGPSRLPRRSRDAGFPRRRAAGFLCEELNAEGGD